MMEARSDDLRVRRTRKLIQEAMVALTIEKGFSSVSVQDIAERAMVNRATFYRHYLDKYDLLDQYMNDVYHLTASQEPVPTAQAAGLDAGPPAGLVNLVEHIKLQAAFYRVMLGRNGDVAFVQRLREYIEQRFRTVLADEQLLMGAWKMPMELCLSYVSHASVGAIVWWLNDGAARSPMELATWLNELSQATIALGLGQRQ